MVADQILSLLKRLENTYGPYSKEQLALIIGPATKLEKATFEQVINDLLMEGRKPAPKTVIREIGKAFDLQCQRHNRKAHPTNPIQPGVNCNVCNDAGFVLHKRATEESGGMKIFASCLCQDNEAEWGYRIQDPRQALTLPKSFLKPVPGENIWDKVAELRDWKETSKAYWKSKFCPPDEQEALPW